MIWKIMLSLVLMFVAWPVTVWADEGLDARLNQIMNQLDSPNPADRQAASDALLRLPSGVLPLIESSLARQDISPEVRARLEAAVAPLRVKSIQDQRHRQMAQWCQLLVDSYDRVGHKDPRWDADARVGLQKFAVYRARFGLESAGNPDTVSKPLEAALRAGCDDPAVRFACGWALSNQPDADRKCRSYLSAAATQIQASRYPASWRTVCLIDGAVVAASDAQRMELAEKALVLLPDAVADKPMPPPAAVEMGTKLIEQFVQAHMDRKLAMDRVLAAIARTYPKDSLVALVLCGKCYIAYAWDARGCDWAPKVTDEGWKLFAERLALAQTALENAWKLDPGDPMAPTAMLTVELGQGQGQGRMETWFRRAMETDPDNFEACNNKATYLMPRWYGNEQEMFAFGHECAASPNLDAHLGLILSNMHAQEGGWGLTGRGNPDYYQQPGVWNDIEPMFATLLKAYPDNYQLRSQYAIFAVAAGQWETADRLLSQLPDGVSLVDFYNREELQGVAADVSRRAREHLAVDFGRRNSERRRQQLLRWLRGNLEDAYDRVGDRNAAWDAAAHRVLDLALHQYANDPDRAGDEPECILAACPPIFTAGCKDPLLRFIEADMQDAIHHIKGPQSVSHSFPAAMALRDSAYPPALKLLALLHGARSKCSLETADKRHAEELRPGLESMLDLVDPVLSAPDIPKDFLANELLSIVDACKFTDGNQQTYFDKLNARLEKVPDHFVPLLMTGYAYANSASEMTLNFQANPGHPTPAEAKIIEQCYTLAHDTLQQAWRMDPEDPMVSAGMVLACEGQPADRGAMELWFRRAMEADPDNAAACRFKGEWLAPNRNGSEKALADFARACVAGNNIRGRIDLVAIDLYVRLARWANGKDSSDMAIARLRAGYYWSDLQDLFERRLAEYPNDLETRTRYAKLAFAAQQWDLANQQFQFLGDRVRVAVFTNQSVLDEIRRRAAQAAGHTQPPSLPAE